MKFEIVEIDCCIFGDFKVGDNAVYNASVLCSLVERNDDGALNKPIVLQVASILEVCFAQIFYRAANFNREGVPNISEDDQNAIAIKQIDKLEVIIANLRKYRMLEGMPEDIYDELTWLRKFRNKIHIQNKSADMPNSETALFNERTVRWALNLNWNILNYLRGRYERPEHIRGYVQPLRLPKLVFAT